MTSKPKNSGKSVVGNPKIALDAGEIGSEIAANGPMLLRSENIETGLLWVQTVPLLLVK